MAKRKKKTEIRPQKMWFVVAPLGTISSRAGLSRKSCIKAVAEHDRGLGTKQQSGEQ